MHTNTITLLTFYAIPTIVIGIVLLRKWFIKKDTTNGIVFELLRKWFIKKDHTWYYICFIEKVGY